MSETFRTLITRVGAARLATAEVEETTIPLTKIVLGSRNAQPDAALTVLDDEVWRGPLSAITAAPDDPGTLVIEAVVPVEAGGFTIRQAGVLDEQDRLILVASVPETYKPTRSAGSTRDLVIRFYMAVSNTDRVDLLIDPNVAIASQNSVRNAIKAAIRTHDQDTDAHPNLTPPDATHTQRGIAELATEEEVADGTDPARIVTPATLKAWSDDKLVQATTSELGLVELATMEEAAAGLDDTHAVTPAGLKSWGGGVEQAFADLALRHALEQEAALITGPNYQGQGFAQDKAGATAQAGWSYAPGFWHSGIITRSIGAVDLNMENWDGSLNDDVIEGGGDTGYFQLATPSGNWDLSFRLAQWNPPDQGTATKARGKVQLSVPASQQTRSVIQTVSSGSDDDNPQIIYGPVQYRSFPWQWIDISTSDGRVYRTTRTIYTQREPRPKTIEVEAKIPGVQGNASGEVLRVVAGTNDSLGGWLKYRPNNPVMITAFTGGSDASDRAHLGFYWNTEAASDLSQPLPHPVLFRGGPDPDLMINNTLVTDHPAYQGRLYRWSRVGDRLALYDDTAKDNGGAAVLLQEWTIPTLNKFGLQVDRGAYALTLDDISLRRGDARGGALTVTLSKTASVPARIAMAMRMADADVTGLTAEASRDGGVRWITMSLDKIRLDEAGRAIITGSAGWPADTPAGRDLQLRFTAASDTQYQLFGIGTMIGE